MMNAEFSLGQSLIHDVVLEAVAAGHCVKPWLLLWDLEQLPSLPSFHVTIRRG